MGLERLLRALGDRTGGGHAWLVAHSSPVTIFDHEVRLIDLPWLIAPNRAAGRPKDLEAIAELETNLEERGQPQYGLLRRGRNRRPTGAESITQEWTGRRRTLAFNDPKQP